MLSAGARLGPYEVISPLGAGGMGEVYRARDTRLDRTVALKVLPDDVAQSPERKARFEREARAISRLSHANICTLHDIGSQDGTDFLVMELIEGETLAERLKRGPLPAGTAVEYAIQMADALDTAHRAGIVHRDLKPGNVMLTKTGVKLLDFGLARLHGAEPVSDSSQAPTLQDNLTAEQGIVGTLRYMAPEQLEGRVVDARADLFALGALLCEMLTGSPAFDGTSQAGIVAAVLTSEPPGLRSVPGVSAGLDRTVRKCLARDPDERWQTARDLLDELRWIHSEPKEGAAVAVSPRGRPVSIGLAALAGAILGGLGLSLLAGAPPESKPRRFREPLPAQVGVKYSPPLVISPDGERMVLCTGGSIVSSGLLARSLEEFGWRPLPETDNGDMPFFSPDGEWLGYFLNDELRKVRVSGGPSVTIGRVQLLRSGATWGPDDTIVFASAGSGLTSIPAKGGEAEPLTSLQGDEGLHRWPDFLPDGSAIVFTVTRGDRYYVAVLDRETGVYRVLEELGEGRAARYVDGHLVFVSKGRLVAAGFDADRLEITSPPALVAGVEDLHVSPGSGLPYFTISRTGYLAYIAGEQPRRRLVRVDRDGASTPLTGERDYFQSPRFSPDGSKVAVTVNTTRTWIYDLASGTRGPLTAQPQSIGPTWGPGPDTVTFTVGYRRVYWTRVGDSADTLLLEKDRPAKPAAWTPDGSALVFEERHPTRRGDIGTVTLDGEGSPLLASDFDETYPDLSPDGRWIAYVSDESGQDEVYVDRFPELGARVPISIGGGGEPLWSARGDELFYRHQDRMLAVPITTTSGLRAGRPRELFRGPYLSPATKGGESRTYDVDPDGEHFLMLEAEDEESPMELRVVLNWLDELEAHGADD